MRVVLKRGNDQIVTLIGLRTTDTPPVYLNSATVMATLNDSRGNPVSPFVDVPMPYVAGSNGNYDWVIEGTEMMLPKSVEYTLVFLAEQGGLNYRVAHVVSVVDGD